MKPSTTLDIGPEAPDENNMLELTEDQWADRYGPEENDDGSTYVQREWYEAEDRPLIEQAIRDGRCWTAVEGDNGEFCIEWGNRTVNRLYNIITSRPIEDQSRHVVINCDNE